MNLERALDRRIMGYRSVLGFYRWLKAAKGIITDRHASVSDKFWCLQHGFTMEYFNLYGHENLRANYKKYLSSRQYNKLHPINGMFSLWIDDKLTIKHVFSKFDEFLPRYYFDIEDGKALKLADCPDSVKQDGFEGVLELIRQEKKIALKQLLGAFGIGFYRLEYIDGEYYITGEKASAEEIKTLLKSLNYYLVTEYITNHETIYNIWPGATNTLRILIGTVDQEPILMRSFMRFGNASSHGVDNAHSGGLEAVIDEETGRVLFAVALDAKGCATKITEHPDSGASFDFQIPRWDQVVNKCKEICRAFPELRYWGFDIAITQNGFKILEINSLSGLMAAQLKEPLLEDPKTRRVFESFGLKLK